MKGIILKDNVTINGIANESQLEIVNDTAEKSGCKVELKECATVAVITGTPAQRAKFVKLWND